MRNHPTQRPSRHSGAALFIALVMLLLVTIIGLAIASTQTLETRMSTNLQNHTVAEQSAEAALRFAENQYNTGTYTDFTGNTAGLYQFSVNGTSPPAYLCVSVWANYLGSTACGTTTFGTKAYAGNSMPGTAQPNFIIENMPPVCSTGCALNSGNTGRQPPPVVLRVTANGYGLDGTSTVRLQSIYH
jgi:type IV pilus assembly protein PilX